MITHLGCWETLEKLVKNSPLACDLQAILVFSQNPVWVIKPINPLKVWSIAYYILSLIFLVLLKKMCRTEPEHLKGFLKGVFEGVFEGVWLNLTKENYVRTNKFILFSLL